MKGFSVREIRIRAKNFRFKRNLLIDEFMEGIVMNDYFSTGCLGIAASGFNVSVSVGNWELAMRSVGFLFDQHLGFAFAVIWNRKLTFDRRDRE